jgi:hypothetical protein
MLEKLEGMMNTLAKYLTEYRDWTEIMHDTKRGVTSVGAIQQSIEKYRTCLNKYSLMESGLLNVCDKLAEESK